MAENSTVTPEDDWSLDMEVAPKDRRILVWLPEMPFCPARPVFARWEDDRYAARPRPFWLVEGRRVSDSRAHQPVAWRLPPVGPASLTPEA